MQLTDEMDNQTTFAVFHNGEAKIVNATHKINGESQRLAEPYSFRILSLDN